MRVVITGATGAIGHALIAECIKQNIEVLAICHRGSQRADMLVDEVGRMLQSKRVGLDCEFPNCESSNEQLMNRETLDRLIKIEYLNLDEYATGLPSGPYDIFFHMAWSGTTGASRNDEALQQQNAAYSLDAVRLAKKLGCHTFVFAGSQAEYGRVEGKLTADTPTYPENEYGKYKLQAGETTRALCESLSIKHIWARILSVYGPYDSKTSMIMSAISKLRNGEIAEFTKGEQQWDYLYSADAANALLLAAMKGKHGRIYPIGSGSVRALSEYIQILKNQIDPHAQIELGAVPYAPRQVMYLCADIAQLKQDTGFEPKTEFEDGIREILRLCE
ncbi:MAG: NAD-dependent epimerase/dehydratase family protein [Lachnospiraceae bacterium]